MDAQVAEKVAALKTLGRLADGVQIIILATMGQYLYAGGSQQLTGKHWTYAIDFFNGYQNVGLSLIVIASIGLLGLFSLLLETDVVNLILMWIFSVSATVWFIGVGISHGIASQAIPGAGSTGLWTLGLAGLFFIFSRIAITIGSGITDDIKERR